MEKPEIWLFFTGDELRQLAKEVDEKLRTNKLGESLEVRKILAKRGDVVICAKQ